MREKRVYNAAWVRRRAQRCQIGSSAEHAATRGYACDCGSAACAGVRIAHAHMAAPRASRGKERARQTMVLRWRGGGAQPPRGGAAAALSEEDWLRLLGWVQSN